MITLSLRIKARIRIRINTNTVTPKIKKMAKQKPGLAAILKHRQKSYLLKDIEGEIKKLTEAEVKIIQARSVGLSFCEIEQGSVRAVIDQIMLRGAAIYGCTLPQTEFFATFIAEEMEAMILGYGFSELTEAEIVLALRLNCISGIKFPSGLEIEKVPFTGGTFNVYFISNVLEKYMRIRNMLDAKIQNQIDGYQ